ncbi:putative bicarbonate transporter, IctB family [Microcoleus sp. FACHB-831]|uniref:IctB family putative bicarbonate transporter n=1 Tax=Microcoleus sp. FACHB-831 TaxID=2692827 RepID=UPI00168A11FF|nr:IctB family putative bicarbonate transporter [Microcoleus sp. FACHB-831]MBD1921049.1 putative bicarbonate transporter, IctB family [Microcoleus sp. FACHB-831]
MTVWQQFTLSDLPLYQWQGSSYLYRLVGPLSAWRRSSLLMQWGEPIGALLVSLVFALAPFVPNNQIGVLLSAGAFYWLLLTLSDDGKRGATPVHLLVLLYWAISTVATALSPVKAAAMPGWSKLTLYLLMFALMARVLRSPRLRSWIITVYLHVTLIVGVYGLRQWFFGAAQLATWVDPSSPLSKTTRVYSYLGNPNLLAAYLLPAVALSIAAIFVWRSAVAKALAVTMLIVNLSCSILTFSRGGWIGLALLGLTFLGLAWYWWKDYIPPYWRTWGLLSLLVTMAALLAMGIVFVEPMRDRILSMFVGRGDSSNNFRINVWQAVDQMIRDRPILGIGPGNTAFNKIYPIYQISPRYTALSAYSIPREILVETGFIGFSCFLWLLVVTFNHGWRHLKHLQESKNHLAFWLMAAIAGMVGLLGQGLFDTVWYRPEVNTLWWLMVAIVASFYSSPSLTLPQDTGGNRE